MWQGRRRAEDAIHALDLQFMGVAEQLGLQDLSAAHKSKKFCDKGIGSTGYNNCVRLNGGYKAGKVLTCSNCMATW